MVLDCGIIKTLGIMNSKSQNMSRTWSVSDMFKKCCLPHIEWFYSVLFCFQLYTVYKYGVMFRECLNVKLSLLLSRFSRVWLCDTIDGSPPGSRPWDSPGKNTGVGCHFLLQSMKVKSESEVAQSCPTLRDPVDCSLPGSSTHGIFQARILTSWMYLGHLMYITFIHSL